MRVRSIAVVGGFSYQSTTPGNSSITFVVATGTRDSSGNITNLTADVPLQFTKTSLSGDHACAAAWTSGAADACGYSEDTEIMGPQFGALRSGDILVDTTLQANSLSRNLNYLRIKATLNPSSDGRNAEDFELGSPNLLRHVPMTRISMGNAQLLLATTLLAVAACSGGNSHAPLVAIGAGGSVADASAGGSENGGFGAGRNTGGGSAQNTGGGSAQNTGGGSAQNTGGGSAENTGGGSAQNTGGGSAQNTGGGSAQNTGGSSGLGSGGTSGTGSGGGGVIGGGGSGAEPARCPSARFRAVSKAATAACNDIATASA